MTVCVVWRAFEKHRLRIQRQKTKKLERRVTCVKVLPALSQPRPFPSLSFSIDRLRQKKKSEEGRMLCGGDSPPHCP